MFQEKVVEEIKKHVLFNNVFLIKKCGKVFTAGQATDINVAFAHCILDN
jgi:hypothetical protein